MQPTVAGAGGNASMCIDVQPTVESEGQEDGLLQCVRNSHTFHCCLRAQCYVRDKEECDGLLRAIHTVPCVGKKAAWARRWIGDGDSCFAERLVAFACVEGIHFSGRCVVGEGCEPQQWGRAFACVEGIHFSG